MCDREIGALRPGNPVIRTGESQGSERPVAALLTFVLTSPTRAAQAAVLVAAVLAPVLTWTLGVIGPAILAAVHAGLVLDLVSLLLLGALARVAYVMGYCQ